MKNRILQIAQKELVRFFSDKRLLITVLILPGVLLYILYSIMGMSSLFNPHNNEPLIKGINYSKSIDTLFKSKGIDIFWSEDNIEQEDISKDINSGKYNLIMILPQNFDDKVFLYDIKTGLKAPNIELFYSSSDNFSYGVYYQACSILASYEETISNSFDINNETIKYDVSEQKTNMQIIKLLPTLIMTMLCLGCTSVAPESIAGEKERGTIATILVTPIKRSEFALGKLLSLTIIALLSGFSSTLGVLLSVPKLMNNTIQLSIQQYILLAIIIMSTVIVIISLLCVISTFANTVREATSSLMPIMLLITIISAIPILINVPDNFIWIYFVPLLNSALSMSDIFLNEYNHIYIIINIISNIVFTGIISSIFTVMLNSEKVLFNK